MEKITDGLEIVERDESFYFQDEFDSIHETITTKYFKNQEKILEISHYKEDLDFMFGIREERGGEQKLINLTEEQIEEMVKFLEKCLKQWEMTTHSPQNEMMKLVQLGGVFSEMRHRIDEL